MAKVLTLLYHRVRNYEEDVQQLAVAPHNFRQQMEYLRDNYSIVRFDDEWDKIQKDSVCITFDDGYRDNFLNAIPILNELHIPATIFVSTVNINTKKEFWWDELERNILINQDYPKTLTLNHPFWGCTWDTSTRERRQDIYYSLHQIMKYHISVEERMDWLKQLQRWNNWTEDGREENISMQTKDLADLDLNNITIGSHTVNHPSLASLNYCEQYQEIKKAKEDLEDIFKIKVNTFSYPFGGEIDYNENTIKICKELKLKKVAANRPGLYDSSVHTSMYEIPRCIVRDWNIKEFSEKIRLFWRGEE